MTYDYREGATPRGQGENWGRQSDRAGLDPSRQRRARTQPQHPGNPYPAGDTYGTRGPAPHGNPPSRAGNVSPPSGQPRAQGARSGPGQYQQPGNQPSTTPSGSTDAQPRQKRRTRAPLVIVVVLLLALGGGGWYFLQGPGSDQSSNPNPQIADRQVDPAPLTMAEVFDSDRVPGTEGAFKVLKTQSSDNCATAASGTITEELTKAGCTQVVRATLMSSDDTLVMTAGIFNLETREKALTAAAAIKKAVDEGKGRFAGMVAGDKSNIVSRAAANLSWEVRGHYMAYGLVAHADGSAIAEDHDRADAILNDLVKSHLGNGVLQKRETGSAPQAVTSSP